MQVKIFADEVGGRLEEDINNFLRQIPRDDIVQIESHVNSQVVMQKLTNVATVFIWLHADAPTRKETS